MQRTIPEKANRVLNILLLGFFLILVRVWHLSVIQHDEHVILSKKPKRRSVVEKTERATIRDRFNIPLAINKIQYAASVCYADIRLIPSTKWQKGPDGKSHKIQPRANYIQKLSSMLAKELDMEAQEIEDIIHAKASLFPHTPFVLKKGISEELFYRLKMLEADFPGLCAEKNSVRYYPQGKIASDVIGYMGAISSNEYFNIAQEIKTLQAYLLERESGEMPILPKGFNHVLEVRERLRQLQEKSYTINDLVGKSGVEAAFDGELRGYFGKKIYEIDTKGNLLHKLPGGRDAVPGHRLLLSISSELQKYAEQLLTQHEQFRDSSSTPSLATPWIKGGALVAMDPKTGEVLALASYPRFDPNDFISSSSSNPKQQSNVLRWLENEAYIGEIWEGKRPLERERFNPQTKQFYEETLYLSWDHYLEAILPKNSALFLGLQKIKNIKNVYFFECALEKLLALSGQEDLDVLLAVLYSDSSHRPLRKQIPAEKIEKAKALLQGIHLGSLEEKHLLDKYLGAIYCLDDQLLFIDLCKLLIDQETFSRALIDQIGEQTLSDYFKLNQCAVRVQNLLHGHAGRWFHAIDFQKWRDAHFKEFLKGKRQEEKEKKRYARPYTEYLEQLEKKYFQEFWKKNRWTLMNAFLFGEAGIDSLSKQTLEPYLSQIDLLQKGTLHPDIKTLQSAAQSLSHPLGLDYLKTMRSFQDLKRPLVGKYRNLRHTQGIQLQKHLAGAFYPLLGYGHGRSQAFRQSTPAGSVFKVVVAYQALLEKYQKLNQNNPSFQEVNPLTLIDKIQWTAKPGSNSQVLGYTLDGNPIQRLYKGGRLPRSHPNIGKIDLVGALEQSSNIYFSILASDYIENPWNLIEASKQFGFGKRSGIELPGEIPGNLPDDITHNQTGLYSFAIGQHSLVVTPLQTAVMLSAIANKGHVLTPKIVQVIAGSEPFYEYQNPFDVTTFPYQETLSLIGIDFPLFTASLSEKKGPQVWYSSPEVKTELTFPPCIEKPILEGMGKVINGSRGTARPGIIRFLSEHPDMRKNFYEIKDQLIGKTGTAEILYKQSIDAESQAQIHNHIWFGGVSYSEETKEPELAIAVYLRFSESGGKEAAPLAAEIVKKWREICKKHGVSSYVLPP